MKNNKVSSYGLKTEIVNTPEFLQECMRFRGTSLLGRPGEGGVALPGILRAPGLTLHFRPRGWKTPPVLLSALRSLLPPE